MSSLSNNLFPIIIFSFLSTWNNFFIMFVFSVILSLINYSCHDMNFFHFEFFFNTLLSLFWLLLFLLFFFFFFLLSYLFYSFLYFHYSVPSALQGLIDHIDRDLTFALETEHGKYTHTYTHTDIHATLLFEMNFFDQFDFILFYFALPSF